MTTATSAGAGADKNWSISLRPDVVLVEFKPGTVLTREIIKNITDAMNAQPEKYRASNAVWDTRNIAPDPEAGFDEMFRVKEYIQTHWEGWWPQAKLALLISSRVNYGMSRMFASLAESKLKYEVRLFKDDLQAAIEWARTSD